MKRVDLLPTDFDGAVARLVEDCGEILQAVGKMQRFGITACDPKTGKLYDNLEDLKGEMLDVEHAIGEVRRFALTVR